MALSHRPADRILQKAGAERISEAAARKLASVMEAKATEISERAKKYARQSGRKTISPEDIKRALK